MIEIIVDSDFFPFLNLASDTTVNGTVTVGPLSVQSELNNAMNFVYDAIPLFGVAGFSPTLGFIATWKAVASNSSG